MPIQRKTPVEYNKCLNCGKDAGFKGSGKYIRLSRPKKFCCISCSSKFKHKDKVLHKTCPFCKKQFKKWPDDGVERKFCSMSCYNKVREVHFPKYDLPQKDKKRYKMKKINGKQIYFHRWTMEQHLGRKLTRSEIVHHIDGDPHNNNIDNLMIMTQSEHMSLEHKNWEKTLLISP